MSHWRSLEWNGMFTRDRLKVNLEKTEGLHIDHPAEGRAGHRAGGGELTQGDSLVELGGAVCGDGKTEGEVRRRVGLQAGANARIAVEGVMADLRISKWS